MIWFCYHYAETLIAVLGEAGARVLSRMVAFLLLCIGTQIIVHGVEDLAGAFLAAQRATAV